MSRTLLPNCRPLLLLACKRLIGIENPRRLAVGAPSLGGSTGVRRSTTATEQKHIEQMARELLTSNGVPATSLNRMRVTQATATVLNHSLKLIASV
jgi:hypothetical protein